MCLDMTFQIATGGPFLSRHGRLFGRTKRRYTTIEGICERSRDAAGDRKTIITGLLHSDRADVKIRGTAAHVYEKYLQLAREPVRPGTREAENYLQHASIIPHLMAQGPR